MTMGDWKAELDRYLAYQRADILTGKGKISRESADEKVDREYKKYLAHNPEIAPVDKDYFRALSREVKRLEGNGDEAEEGQHRGG